MRIMAVDFGDARTGVAVSDASATLTGDAWVITGKRLNDVISSVVNEALARGVSNIVVGLPKNMDGSVGSRAEKCIQFAESIRSALAQSSSQEQQSSSIEVIMWDERLTTMGAHRVLSDVGKFGKKRKKTVDAVAASLILEGYLGSIKK